MFLAPIRYDAVHKTNTRNDTEQQAFHSVQYFTLRIPSEDKSFVTSFAMYRGLLLAYTQTSSIAAFFQSTLMHTSAKIIDTVTARVDAR